jgi:hypothetical protein
MDSNRVVMYLRAHTELRDAAVKDVVRELKAVGLIARATNWVDCRGMPRLMRAAYQCDPVRSRCQTCGHVLPTQQATAERL